MAAIIAVLAWGQGGTVAPGQGVPKAIGVPVTHTPAYLLNEIEKLKKQTSDLKTKLGAAEAHIAAVETKHEALKAKLKSDEEKVPFGSDYAGGGWTTKHNFLTRLDPNKTMIRFVKVK